ncbi:hypothetical protein C7964_11210 [Loktanella sp. PT4BL]|nr:hypothetical protein C7964_11210 [Loktanella sp. PT4BL]
MKFTLRIVTKIADFMQFRIWVEQKLLGVILVAKITCNRNPE